MGERNRNPDPHPLVASLTRDNTVNETEDVISLVGFPAAREQAGPLRLFADEDLQRYMDIPDDGFVHAEPLPDDDRGRWRVYVTRATMIETAFDEDAPGELDGMLHGAGMSTWAFLPENRLVAADLLGLLPRAEAYRYEEEAGP